MLPMSLGLKEKEVLERGRQSMENGRGRKKHTRAWQFEKKVSVLRDVEISLPDRFIGSDT